MYAVADMSDHWAPVSDLVPKRASSASEPKPVVSVWDGEVPRPLRVSARQLCASNPPISPDSAGFGRTKGPANRDNRPWLDAIDASLAPAEQTGAATPA